MNNGGSLKAALLFMSITNVSLLSLQICFHVLLIRSPPGKEINIEAIVPFFG